MACAHDDFEDSDDESDDEAPVISNSNGDESPDDLNPEAWLVGISLDPLKHVRRLVRFLRSSDQRKEEFKQFIITGNAGKWFGEKETDQVPVLEPLRDVKTRWDSVYLMLK